MLDKCFVQIKLSWSWLLGFESPITSLSLLEELGHPNVRYKVLVERLARRLWSLLLRSAVQVRRGDDGRWLRNARSTDGWSDQGSTRLYRSGRRLRVLLYAKCSRRLLYRYQILQRHHCWLSSQGRHHRWIYAVTPNFVIFCNNSELSYFCVDIFGVQITLHYILHRNF